MTGEELYEAYRGAARTSGVMCRDIDRTLKLGVEDAHLPHWYQLREKERQLWEETASRIPVVSQTREAVYGLGGI